MTEEISNDLLTKKEKLGLAVRKTTRLSIQLGLAGFMLLFFYSVYAALAERFPFFPEFSVFIMLAVILVLNRE